jgi:hypothetical protein
MTVHVTCVGTPRYPGCGHWFTARDGRTRFCPDCSALDKKSSFVFVERRRRSEEAHVVREQQEEENE